MGEKLLVENTVHCINRKTVCLGSKRQSKVERTDERFRLLLKPPSLILRGATFLVLALFFLSAAFAVGFDFLRQLGPVDTKQKGRGQSHTEPRIT